jgi:uncharacterized membrane protein YoaK (UPF0700 family)
MLGRAMSKGPQYWLARLPMTFLAIGLVLIYEIYRSMTHQVPALPMWKLVLFMVAAAMCIALFVAGVKARHRQE